jgi:hypothetical protein
MIIFNMRQPRLAFGSNCLGTAGCVSPTFFVEEEMVFNECLNEEIAMVIALMESIFPNQIGVGYGHQIVGQQMLNQWII